jgi:bifunctional DNA-binding transcriptional regulator/antitoxin component of YhaV-PrlF toxin-antitoxin module
MVALKIAKIGEDLAVVLTPELREALGVAEGDTLYAEQSEAGGVTLVANDLSFEARRERGRGFIKRYGKTFEALAK